MRAFLVPAVLLLAVPQALAQTAANSGDALARGVACTAPMANTALDANVRKALEEGQAASDAMSARLNQISEDEGVCAPVRDAAKELASTYAAAAAPSEEDEIVAASSAAVAAALAEAERRVANLKFEVGPPPRNMTKGRTPGT